MSRFGFLFDQTKCIGCNACQKTGACVFTDDGSKLISKLSADCDGVFFVSPVYFNYIPGPAKDLIDRFHIVFSPARLADPGVGDKKVGVVFPFGRGPADEYAVVADHIGRDFQFFGYTQRRSVLCPLCTEPTSFAVNPEYQAAVKALADWVLE